MPGFILRLFFRKLLNTRKGRQWRDELTAPGNLPGAPADETKLRHAFRQDMKLHFNRLAATRWIRIGTVGTRIRIQTIKPVKPARKFIITLTDLPQSVQSTEHCIESAKRYGEDRDLEILPAIDKFQSHGFFVRHGLTWRTGWPSLNPLPEMGCFASHFTLWLRCIELGEPIVALEHDAVFCAPIPALRFKHVIVLGKRYTGVGRFSMDKVGARKGREIYHPWRHLMGTHCYAITPEGARRLVEAARRELLTPTDVFMHKRHINILYYHPYLVDLDDTFTSVAPTHPTGGAGERETWKDYKPAQP